MVRDDRCEEKIQFVSGTRDQSADARRAAEFLPESDQTDMDTGKVASQISVPMKSV